VIENCYADGLYLSSTVNTTVETTIFNNIGEDGVDAIAGQITISSCNYNSYGSSGVHISGSATGIVVGNNFTDTQKDYGIKNDTTTMANGENNWWGNSNGPSTVGPGSGVKVSNYVDYTPWATAPVSPSGVVITSVPNLTAEVGSPYQYDEDGCASVSGGGSVLWSILRGPSGFTIDQYSGCITWTPTNAGTVVITIAATGSNGVDTQTFQVTVSVVGGDTVAPRINSFEYQQTGSGTGTWDVLLNVGFSEQVDISPMDVVILDSLQNVIEIDALSYNTQTHTLNVSKNGFLNEETYTFILIDTITDLALNSLDGEFNGYSFPTGNGSAGGDFVATFSRRLLYPWDIDGNGYFVDFADFTILGDHWRDTNCASSNDCDGADLNKDGVVDFADLKILTDHWLENVEP
jgi:hypothetical protein